MGMPRDALGSAQGANEVKNGFNGPKLPIVDNGRGPGQTYGSSGRYGHRVSHNDRSDVQNRLGHEDNPDARRAMGQPSRYFEDEIPPDYNGSGKPEYVANYQTPHSGGRLNEVHSSHYQAASMRQDDTRFRPLALPQIAYGRGQPFLRGYSNDLLCYGIGEEQFIRILDSINVAVVPNPEAQIFQKAASIAGYFVPGAAHIGLIAGRIGVGVAAAFGHASLLARKLSRANLDTFLPQGLELCIGKTSDLDKEVWMAAGQSSGASAMLPEDRIASYGTLVAPLSLVLPPAQHGGRSDPLATLGKGISKRDDGRKVKKALKKARKGKDKKLQALEGDLQWLMVRRATPEAMNHWEKTLGQSQAMLDEEEAQKSR